MKNTLSQQEIKDLKNQCRMGYIIPFFVFTIGSFVGLMIVAGLFNSDNDSLSTYLMILVLIGFGILSVFINYKMNWKYIYDIRYNQKDIEIKIISKKEFKKDYEAGSGTLCIGQEMKGFDSFSIIVDNYRYRVDKDLFMNCNEGDEVIFNYGTKSRYLLNIELKKADY